VLIRTDGPASLVRPPGHRLSDRRRI